MPGSFRACTPRSASWHPRETCLGIVGCGAVTRGPALDAGGAQISGARLAAAVAPGASSGRGATLARCAPGLFTRCWVCWPLRRFMTRCCRRSGLSGQGLLGACGRAPTPRPAMAASESSEVSGLVVSDRLAAACHTGGASATGRRWCLPVWVSGIVVAFLDWAIRRRPNATFRCAGCGGAIGLPGGSGEAGPAGGVGGPQHAGAAEGRRGAVAEGGGCLRERR